MTAKRKVKPAKKAAKAKKPQAEKEEAVKLVKAPPQRESRPGDTPYQVTLQPRHAEWVERRARQSGRTVASMLEKIVREGYAADPNNKTGASTNDATQIDQVAESSRSG